MLLKRQKSVDIGLQTPPLLHCLHAPVSMTTPDNARILSCDRLRREPGTVWNRYWSNEDDPVVINFINDVIKTELVVLLHSSASRVALALPRQLAGADSAFSLAWHLPYLQLRHTPIHVYMYMYMYFNILYKHNIYTCTVQ